MTAVITADGRYRYYLSRPAARGAGHAAFVMLNPSTADANQDDPTIRRCLGFARSLGAATLEVVNLFAWRATDPRELAAVADPIGERNDYWIRTTCARASIVVCAWGARGGLLGRDAAVTRLLRDAGIDLYALRVTKGGAPAHPLYLPATCGLVPFRGFDP